MQDYLRWFLLNSWISKLKQVLAASLLSEFSNFSGKFGTWIYAHELKLLLFLHFWLLFSLSDLSHFPTNLLLIKFHTIVLLLLRWKKAMWFCFAYILQEFKAALYEHINIYL